VVRLQVVDRRTEIDSDAHPENKLEKLEGAIELQNVSFRSDLGIGFVSPHDEGSLVWLSLASASSQTLRIFSEPFRMNGACVDYLLQIVFRTFIMCAGLDVCSWLCP
jgi:hypothetical protein